MAQHDLIIDNAGGATVRADINNALAALGSSMKGPNAPSAPLAGMIWVEDDNPSATVWTVKMYDGADWISLGTLDSTNNRFTATSSVAKAGDTMTGALAMPDGTATAPAVSFSADTNTGLYRIGADIIGVATDGAERLRASNSAITAAVPVVLSAGDPSADNQAARKAYVDAQRDTRAPLPTASSGVGQIAFINPATATDYTLPAGGSWLVWRQQFATSGDYPFVHNFSILAGGSSLGAPGAGFAWVGWAWRIA